MISALSRILVSTRRELIGFSAGVSVLVLANTSPALAQVTEPMQDPLAGSDVFESKGCVECHAVNGIGGTSASDLGQISRRRSF